VGREASLQTRGFARRCKSLPRVPIKAHGGGLMRHVCSFTLLFALCFASALSQKLSVTDLRCEYQGNPLGIDTPRPRLSWKLVSSERDVRQAAHEICVGRDSGSLTQGTNLLWQTGKVLSDQSVFVEYGGPSVQSNQRYLWQVRVWDNHGHESPWSEPHFWEIGLLHLADCRAGCTSTSNRGRLRADQETRPCLVSGSSMSAPKLGFSRICS
jgi:hypothetical protein